MSDKKLEVDVDVFHSVSAFVSTYHCCNALHTSKHNHTGTVSILSAYP